MVFGDRLRSVRMYRGITQQTMADRIGVALRTYQQYEQGRTSPSFELLVAIADVLNVPTDYLLGRDAYLESLGASFDAPRTDPPRRPKSKSRQ